MSVTCSPANPTVVGEKLTRSATFCPAAITNGNRKLKTLNSDPVLNVDTVTLVSPLLLNTTISVSVCPTGTAPKRMLHGVQLNWGVDAPADHGNSTANNATERKERTRLEKGQRMDWGSLIRSSLGVLGYVE